MKCSVCGEENIQPSLGGKDICGRCDCGISPTGEKYSIEDVAFIEQRYRKRDKPYFIKNWNKA